MKLSSKELKRQARETLTGRYGLPMAACAIIQLIVFAIGLPFSFSPQFEPRVFQVVISFLASTIISLISNVLHCGEKYIHLNLSRKKDAKLSDIFIFFSNHPDRFILAGLLLTGMTVFISLPAIGVSAFALTADTTAAYLMMAAAWLVTLIPVTLLSLTYDLVFLLLIEHPKDDIIHSFRESRRLMSGNKKRAFYIDLSFIGMTVLCILSLGIGILWVTPYRDQTNIKFYQNIIGEINDV